MSISNFTYSGCNSSSPQSVRRSAGKCVLSVSPFLEDQATLERLVRPPGWNLHRAPTFQSALAFLQHERPPLVLCETDLGRETWRELLAQIALMRDPPFLVVTSRIADDHLWAEALNLGAYDVLAKPFDVTELTRTFSSVWLRWCERHRAA